MTSPRDQYHERITAMLERVHATQGEAIERRRFRLLNNRAWPTGATAGACGAARTRPSCRGGPTCAPGPTHGSAPTRRLFSTLLEEQEVPA